MPRLTVPGVTLLFLTAGGILAAVSPFPYSDGDLMHYLMARCAGAHPELFLDIWGRPGFTVLYVLPAQWGFAGCQAFSLLLSCLAGWMVAAHFRSHGEPYPALAMGLTVFQPAFFGLSFGAHTEIVHGAFLAAGLLLIERRRYAAAALALSWTAVSRLEAMPMLLVFAVFFVAEGLRNETSAKPGLLRGAGHAPDLGAKPGLLRGVGHAPDLDTKPGLLRGVGHALLLGVFPLLWNALMFIQSGFREPLAIVTRNPFLASRQSPYAADSGPWHHFLLSSWEIHGPLIAMLALLGLVAMLRRGSFLVPAYIIAFYVLQSALWATGSFLTAGYSRFFAAIAPAVAIAATHGAIRLAAAVRTRSPHVKAGALCVGVLLACAAPCIVHVAATGLVRYGPMYAALDRALESIRAQRGAAEVRLMTSSPYVAMKLRADPWGGRCMLGPSDRDVERAEAGAFIIYSGDRPSHADSLDIMSFYREEEKTRLASARGTKGRNWVHLLDRSMTRPGYRELGDFSVLDGKNLDWEPRPYYVKVFQKVAGGRGSGAR